MKKKNQTMKMNSLNNLFYAKARTEKPKFEIKNEVENEASLMIYEAIGGWYGVEAESMCREIMALDVGTIHVHINSPGGDIFEARAIQVALKQHDAKVIAHVDGVAASAAAFIIMAADEIRIAEGAFIMIHNAWTFAVGDAKDLRKTADLLDSISGTIVNDFVKRTKNSKKQINEWMDEETWFGAEDAVEKGFADSVTEAVSVENKFDFEAFNHTPNALLVPEEEEKGMDKQALRNRLKLFEVV